MSEHWECDNCGSWVASESVRKTAPTCADCVTPMAKLEDGVARAPEPPPGVLREIAQRQADAEAAFVAAVVADYRAHPDDVEEEG